MHFLIWLQMLLFTAWTGAKCCSFHLMGCFTPWWPGTQWVTIAYQCLQFQCLLSYNTCVQSSPFDRSKCVLFQANVNDLFAAKVTISIMMQFKVQKLQRH